MRCKKFASLRSFTEWDEEKNSIENLKLAQNICKTIFKTILYQNSQKMEEKFYKDL